MSLVLNATLQNALLKIIKINEDLTQIQSVLFLLYMF